jgi:hypothetical protein
MISVTITHIRLPLQESRLRSRLHHVELLPILTHSLCSTLPRNRNPAPTPPSAEHQSPSSLLRDRKMARYPKVHHFILANRLRQPKHRSSHLLDMRHRNLRLTYHPYHRCRLCPRRRRRRLRNSIRSYSHDQLLRSYRQNPRCQSRPYPRVGVREVVAMLCPT